MELNKTTFTNIILDNLNNSISDNGKVDLDHFINLTNKTYEAINYSLCCTELKVEKNYIDFEDWKKRHIIDRNHFDNTFLHDTEGWIEEHRLIDKYNNEVMNL